MNITRRDALRGAAAIAATGAVPGAAMASTNRADPLREGVQALVDEIRRDLNDNIRTASFWGLQEAAERLEALPGIEPVANEHWDAYRRDIECRFGPVRVLRFVGPPTAA
jgi:hypothetical protein